LGSVKESPNKALCQCTIPGRVYRAEMIDPSEGIPPDPKAVIAAIGPRSEHARRANWVFTDQI
jgi:hypothetical protein